MAKVLPHTSPTENRVPPLANRLKYRGEVNINPVEGWLSGLSGVVLTAYGLWRRNWSGLALLLSGGGLIYRGVSRHSFLYQVLGINTARSQDLSRANALEEKAIKVEHAVTINRSPQEVFQSWRHLEQLPEITPHLQEVEIQDTLHSHWMTQAPAGIPVEWEAEIVAELENEYIAWRSLPGSTISHEGFVSFVPAPGGRGTEVKAVLKYRPPAGRAGDLLAKLSGMSPDRQVRESLRNFKALMEAGELPTISKQPQGRSRFSRLRDLRLLLR